MARHDRGGALDGRFWLRIHEAGLRFESSGHDTLTVTGPWAKTEGTGTINGRGFYDYLLTVVDGRLSDGEDAIRVRISERHADGTPGPVIYDSQVTGDTHDAALPTVEVGHSSIVIHRSRLIPPRRSGSSTERPWSERI